jgi:phage terminase small subunit
MEKELTVKQKKFVSEYIVNGFNGCKAYQAVYHTVNKKTCEVNSCRLLRIAKVKEFLESELKELFKSEYSELKFKVIENLKQIGFEEKSSSLKVRALDLLAKYLNMYKEIEIKMTQYPPKLIFELPKDEAGQKRVEAEIEKQFKETGIRPIAILPEVDKEPERDKE